MGDNIRPALYQASYEAVVANRMLVEPSSRVTIAGRYCESGDVLVANVDLAPTEPGDIIAMPAAGAYAIPNVQQLQYDTKAGRGTGQRRFQAA